MTHFAPTDPAPFRRPATQRRGAAPGSAPAPTPKTEPVDLAGLTRMDMHVHSTASAGPVIHAASWVDAPECYSEPEEVYMQAVTRGMDLVTITDHDTIRGALSLVERGYPHVLIGQEVTVRFPEDRVKLHVLVYGLTPELDEQITTLGLRDDVYAFAAWLAERNLPHSLAHPLHAQSRGYSVEHLEKCVLLFRSFELINGAHGGPRRDAMERYLRTLSPRRIDELAVKHSLRPLHPRAWVKGVTAGSDDHGLLNVGKAWAGVRCPSGLKIREPLDFVERAMNAEAIVGGELGGAEVLAHQITAVGLNHYGRTMHHMLSTKGQYVASKLVRFGGVSIPSPGKVKLAAHIAKKKACAKITGRKKGPDPLLLALRTSVEPLLKKYPDIARRLADVRDLPRGAHDGPPMASHERMADFFADLSQTLADAMISGALASVAKKDASGTVRNVVGYLLTAAAQAPYLIAMFSEHKERDLLTRVEHEIASHGAGQHPMSKQPRVVMFTDTLADVNGVSRFIQNVADQSRMRGREMTVLTSTRMKMDPRPNVVNFEPVFSRPMPRYENLDFALPPLLPVLRYIQDFKPDVINVATPGPIGTLGLLCAAIFRCPVVGVYHTDFPAYIDRLFEDETYTWISEKFMKAFYTPYKTILTRSRDYMTSLDKLGFAGDKVKPLLPGMDTDAFHVNYRDESVWAPLGLRESSRKVVYCGRVSVEKNLPMLERVWAKVQRLLVERDIDAELVVIGDGPFRKGMQERLTKAQIARTGAAHFLGFRHGEELSRLYASSDLFVFPSITDTLGQVVMEAQASGLPVIVTDKGGPKEMVDHALTGLVIPNEDETRWAEAIVEMLEDDERRERMGRAAHNRMQRYNIAASFDHFWQVHVDAHHAKLRALGVTTQEQPVNGARKGRGEEQVVMG
ncbi:MAG: glycosyltransferase [Phycisphaerales bacterium]